MTVELHAGPRGQQPALLLRPWAEPDLPDLIGVYRDPVMRRDAAHPIDNDQAAQQWLAVQQRGWAAGDRLSFAVREPEPRTGRGRLVGNVVLKGHAAGKRSAEVGYWTAADARGRGVASRALAALTDWAFESFGASGLDRLDLIHQVDNHASCRVARTCGYALVDVLPASPPAFPADGHRHARYRACPVPAAAG